MEYQYDSGVRQEPGVTIDDDTGVSWWSHDITNESQPWLETTFVWMTCLRNAILGVKKGGSRSMTTLESAWWSPQTSPDIKYNISSHSGQLSLKKYCRKSALTACSPLFSQSGTWASTTTSSGMWDHIVGGCVIPFWNQWTTRNQESWDFHEKVIVFGFRAGLINHVVS